MRKGIIRIFLVMSLFLVFFPFGCATVGRDFAVSEVNKIQTGKTTLSEVRSMFGSPWRVGIENGKKIWTYGKYHYRLFGETSTKDLVIVFDDKGTVESYTFNTTEHQE
ncbi:MAG: outer membrane protein assembly factor BamE [bacterium]|nr:outer membrane protein assembly factor BamE [bacterium]